MSSLFSKTSRSIRTYRSVIGVILALSGAGCAASESASDEPLSTTDVQADEGEEEGAERSSKGGAIHTCFNWRASGQGPLGGPNSVTADCRNRQGRMVTSQVWLPGCIGNNNGYLVHRGQYFDRSCGNCGLGAEFRPERYRFACTCRRADGSWQPTNIPVSDFLTNIDGRLVCD